MVFYVSSWPSLLSHGACHLCPAVWQQTCSEHFYSKHHWARDFWKRTRQDERNNWKSLLKTTSGRDHSGIQKHFWTGILLFFGSRTEKERTQAVEKAMVSLKWKAALDMFGGGGSEQSQQKSTEKYLHLYSSVPSSKAARWTEKDNLWKGHGVVSVIYVWEDALVGGQQCWCFWKAGQPSSVVNLILWWATFWAQTFNNDFRKKKRKTCALDSNGKTFVLLFLNFWTLVWQAGKRPSCGWTDRAWVT